MMFSGQFGILLAITFVSGSPITASAWVVAPNFSCRPAVSKFVQSTASTTSQNPCETSPAAAKSSQSGHVVSATDLRDQVGDLHFTPQELQSLVLNARTSAEHRRLAGYYSLRADTDLAQAMHQQKMAIDYSASSVGSSSKFTRGTVDHCVAIVKRLKQHAARMRKLQQQQEQLAMQSGE
jgi:hypothetical protein